MPNWHPSFAELFQYCSWLQTASSMLRKNLSSAPICRLRRTRCLVFSKHGSQLYYVTCGNSLWYNKHSGLRIRYGYDCSVLRWSRTLALTVHQLTNFSWINLDLVKQTWKYYQSLDSDNLARAYASQTKQNYTMCLFYPQRSKTYDTLQGLHAP